MEFIRRRDDPAALIARGIRRRAKGIVLRVEGHGRRRDAVRQAHGVHDGGGNVRIVRRQIHGRHRQVAGNHVVIGVDKPNRDGAGKASVLRRGAARFSAVLLAVRRLARDRGFTGENQLQLRRFLLQVHSAGYHPDCGKDIVQTGQAGNKVTRP